MSGAEECREPSKEGSDRRPIEKLEEIDSSTSWPWAAVESSVVEFSAASSPISLSPLPSLAENRNAAPSESNRDGNPVLSAPSPPSEASLKAFAKSSLSEGSPPDNATNVQASINKSETPAEPAGRTETASEATVTAEGGAIAVADSPDTQQESSAAAASSTATESADTEHASEAASEGLQLLTEGALPSEIISATATNEAQGPLSLKEARPDAGSDALPVAPSDIPADTQSGPPADNLLDRLPASQADSRPDGISLPMTRMTTGGTVAGAVTGSNVGERQLREMAEESGGLLRSGERTEECGPMMRRALATATQMQRMWLRVPSKVRRALPAPLWCAQYPLNVLSTRRKMRPFIARFPPPSASAGAAVGAGEPGLAAGGESGSGGDDDVYAVIETRESSPDETYLPPGSRWLAVAPAQFARFDRATGSLAALPVCTHPLSTGDGGVEEEGEGFFAGIRAARHALKAEGLWGLYRGALSLHAIERLHSLIERHSENAFSRLDSMDEHRKQRQTLLLDGGGTHADTHGDTHGDKHGDTLSDTQQIEGSLGRGRWIRTRRFLSFFGSSESRSHCLKFAASMVASTITYPLRTIQLRKIVYEPFDGKHLGFVDMTRLTIIYDGPPALYRGFLAFLSARIAQTVGLLSAHATAKAFPSFLLRKADTEEARSFNASIISQVEALLEILTQPLTDLSEHRQILSRIPGLAYKTPSLRASARQILSTNTLTEMFSSVMMLVAALAVTPRQVTAFADALRTDTEA